MKKKRSKEGKEEKDFHVQIFKHMKSLVNKYKRWKTSSFNLRNLYARSE
jgi:hypothetical protein